VLVDEPQCLGTPSCVDSGVDPVLVVSQHPYLNFGDGVVRGHSSSICGID
jgi:hypothetical protein